jgi:hypothetical protein
VCTPVSVFFFWGSQFFLGHLAKTFKATGLERKTKNKNKDTGVHTANCVGSWTVGSYRGEKAEKAPCLHEKKEKKAPHLTRPVALNVVGRREVRTKCAH